jgi:perosamine synthetase
MYRTEYECRFAEVVGAAGARAFTLGRHALAVSLKAIGVQAGDRVGVCGYTCLSVVEAIKVCGAIPIYLDIDETLCISPDAILRHRPNSLRVVILQHTFGNLGQLDRLLAACDTIHAEVIEDCAHAFGCSWNGKPVGQFGRGAIYSFQWGKPYTTGQGGMLTIHSNSLLARVDEEIARWAAPMPLTDDLKLGIQRRIYSFVQKTGLDPHIRYLYYALRERGTVKESFPLSSDFFLYPGYIQLAGERMAAAGLAQLKKWPQLQAIRRDKVASIQEAFVKAGLPLCPISRQADITLLRYPLLSAHKAEILRVARRMKVDIAGWYNSPVHPLDHEGLAVVDYRMGDCPQSESFITRLLHLPTGPCLTRGHLDRMIGILAHPD